MLAVITSRQLTEAHRIAQLHLTAVAVRQLRAVWSLLNPEDLDGTFEDWLIAVVPLVDSQRRASATLAARYITTFRALELGLDADPFVPVLSAPVNRKALTTSMLVTGPISIRGNLGRMTLAKAVDVAEGRTSSAAMRHVLNGGRETITKTIQADGRAVGYQRVTSGNACEFCSMLADRGPVYGKESADFAAHDRCGCTAEPVYGTQAGN